MHTDAIITGDGQRTQVGPDSLDYVLRYAAGDYDCFYQGRYIGSRPTLAKAILAVEEEQAKAARHPQRPTAVDDAMVACQEELHAIAARLTNLANQLARQPAEHAPARAQLTLAHMRMMQAIRNVQDAERSLRLAQRAAGLELPLDVAA